MSKHEGGYYYALHGRRVAVPEKLNERSDPGALAWHNDHCFR